MQSAALCVIPATYHILLIRLNEQATRVTTGPYAGV
jgi:hypothetical protein